MTAAEILGLDLDREGLIGALQDPGRAIRHAAPVSRPVPGRNRCYLLWSVTLLPSVEPIGLVVRQEDRDELFAWATTYVGGWRPLSAFIRVFSAESISHEFVPEPKRF